MSRNVLIGNIWFSQSFLESIYRKKLYIVIGKTAYELHYSNAQQSIYALPVIVLQDRTKAKYEVVSAKELNEKIGNKIFIEEL